MTRRKGGISREVTSLNKTGGQGGRRHNDTTQWTFDCLPTACQNRAVPLASYHYYSNTNNSVSSNSVSQMLDDDMSEDGADQMLNDEISEDVDDDEMFFDCSDDDDSVVYVSQIPPCSEPSGNRIVHYPTLVSAFQAIGSCPHCTSNEMESFFRFCDENIYKIKEETCQKKNKLSYVHGNTDAREWYREWKHRHPDCHNCHSLTVQDITHDLATDICITCDRCRGTIATVEAAKIKEVEKTKSDLCQHEINVLFCFALQLMGVGGEHAGILTAFLNLPEPTKWNQQFNVLKSFTHDAIQRVKNMSEEEAAQEEVAETVRDESHTIQQNLLEQEIPLHCIQASYNMGWQVCSSSGKYGFPTGHGLLVGALTKKVLDNVVYNKKCGVCTKHYSCCD
jgi:hypothetical protein